MKKLLWVLVSTLYIRGMEEPDIISKINEQVDAHYATFCVARKLIEHIKNKQDEYASDQKNGWFKHELFHKDPRWEGCFGVTDKGLIISYEQEIPRALITPWGTETFIENVQVHNDGAARLHTDLSAFLVVTEEVSPLLNSNQNIRYQHIKKWNNNELPLPRTFLSPAQGFLELLFMKLENRYRENNPIEQAPSLLEKARAAFLQLMRSSHHYTPLPVVRSSPPVQKNTFNDDIGD